MAVGTGLNLKGWSSCDDDDVRSGRVVIAIRSPSFYEEVKIRLPARLTDAHHLLFTFYHVACQRGKADPPAVPPHATIGYTWLPLLRDNRLATGSFGLPVSVDPLPPSYSVLHPDVQLPTMKWVDAHKPLFTVALHPVSSVHTHVRTAERAGEEGKGDDRHGGIYCPNVYL